MIALLPRRPRASAWRAVLGSKWRAGCACSACLGASPAGTLAASASCVRPAALPRLRVQPIALPASLARRPVRPGLLACPVPLTLWPPPEAWLAANRAFQAKGAPQTSPSAWIAQWVSLAPVARLARHVPQEPTLAQRVPAAALAAPLATARRLPGSRSARNALRAHGALQIALPAYPAASTSSLALVRALAAR